MSITIKTSHRSVGRDEAKSWKIPSFQRWLRTTNKRLLEVDAYLANTKSLPGTIIIGVLGSNSYIVDGQHRVSRFLASKESKAKMTLKFLYADTEAELAEEYERENGQLISFVSDDRLRSIATHSQALAKLLDTFQQIGCSETGKLSATLILKAWRLSDRETPGPSPVKADDIVRALESSPEEATRLTTFLSMCFDAWGADKEYSGMWTNLNLTLCAWLWKRSVVTPSSSKIPVITTDQFRSGLMALTADKRYIDFLKGRRLSLRDRKPVYTKLKAIIAGRLESDMGIKVALPSPDWTR